MRGRKGWKLRWGEGDKCVMKDKQTMQKERKTERENEGKLWCILLKLTILL